MLSYDFIAVDFETANDNLNSACSMGLVAVKNLKIVGGEHFLIRPANLHFAKKNIAIHGITPQTVRGAPLFPEVWAQAKRYFNNSIIVAHNAYFDMSVLKRCLIESELQMPQFNYLCSIQISNRACAGQRVGASLPERARYFGISTEGHHNAFSDARMCANLVIKTVKSLSEKTFQDFCKTHGDLSIKEFTALKPQKYFQRRRFENIATSEIVATAENFDERHPLYNKTIVFTGELQKMDRRTAMQKAVNRGGFVKNYVSRKTDIVVRGIQDQALVGPEGTSGKERKAAELIEKGYEIEIIAEKEFLELLSLGEN